MLWVYFSLYKLSSNKAIVVAAGAGVIFLYFFRLSAYSFIISIPFFPSHLFFLACPCHSLLLESKTRRSTFSKFEMIFDFLSFRKL